MKKKILLLAYTNINFGDDMFVKTICKYFPEQEFILKAPAQYSEIFSSVPNLHIIHQTRWSRLWERVARKLIRLGFEKPVQYFRFRKYAAIVYVIGGLFDEDEIWHTNVNQCGLKTMKDNMWQYAWCPSVPFFLLGCNMTRIHTEKYVNQMRYLFHGLTDICFRDQYSYRNFADLENVRYASDVVFNYPVSLCKKEKFVLISVWGVLLKTDSLPQWEWAKHLWPEYKRLITEVTAYFLSAGIPVKLVSLCENEGDLIACQSVAADFQSNMLEIVNYNGNLNEVIHLFETADFVIGSRFHSVVMALTTNTPVYPIAYESKTKQLLSDLDFQGGYAELETIDSCKISDIVNIYNMRYIHDCTAVKDTASGQFLKLKQLLEE